MELNPRICRYFANTGNCFYGNECNFLHTKPPEVGISSSAPSTPNSSTAHKTAKSQIPCKNIILYGFCRFEGLSCEYNHETAKRLAADSEPKK